MKTDAENKRVASKMGPKGFGPQINRRRGGPTDAAGPQTPDAPETELQRQYRERANVHALREFFGRRRQEWALRAQEIVKEAA